jgi:hypothetical protein
VSEEECLRWFRNPEEQEIQTPETRLKERQSSGTASSSRQSSIQEAALAGASPELVPPPGFPRDSSAQMHLPNRLKSNLHPMQPNSPRTEYQQQASVYGIGPISSFANPTSTSQNTNRSYDFSGKALSNENISGAEMSLSPENSGSTPDTTGSTHNSSHTSYTPSPREENLGYDSRLAGANAGGSSNSWTPYGVDASPAGPFFVNNPGKKVDVKAYEMPQNWDAGMPTGMTSESGFGDMMEAHNWDEIMNQAQQEDAYAKRM